MSEHWESACGKVTLIRGDSYKLSIQADACIFDPPYGIGFQRGGGGAGAMFKNHRHLQKRSRKIIGDDHPFDPRPFLHFPFCAAFGPNHFWDKLPSGHLLAWDKRDGRSSNDSFVDAEFIWMNRRAPRNLVRHLWKGVCRSRSGEDANPLNRRVHVSQKPVRVMMHIIECAKLPPNSLIYDPFMGGASTAIAALKCGHRFIGVDKSKVHYKTALARVQAFLATLDADTRA